MASKLHPIKSIEARTQSYVLNHFEKSKYAKRLRMLKDTHLGEMCFIIGNGPSLSADDLEVLHKNNVLSFGFNRIFLMFDKTNWRPDFYVSQDEKMLLNCQDDVNNLEISAKIIPLIKLISIFTILISRMLYTLMCVHQYREYLFFQTVWITT